MNTRHPANINRKKSLSPILSVLGWIILALAVLGGLYWFLG